MLHLGTWTTMLWHINHIQASLEVIALLWFEKNGTKTENDITPLMIFLYNKYIINQFLKSLKLMKLMKLYKTRFNICYGKTLCRNACGTIFVMVKHYVGTHEVPAKAKRDRRQTKLSLCGSLLCRYHKNSEIEGLNKILIPLDQSIPSLKK